MDQDFERWRVSPAGQKARREGQELLAKGKTRKQIGVMIVDSGSVWLGDQCNFGEQTDPKILPKEQLVTQASIGDGTYRRFWLNAPDFSEAGDESQKLLVPLRSSATCWYTLHLHSSLEWMFICW